MSVDCISCPDTFDTERAMRIHHSQAHNESLAKETSECEDCNTKFEYYPSEKRGRFCSECVQEHNLHITDKSQQKEITCKVCGEVMSVRQSSPAKFCSKKCSGLYSRGYEIMDYKTEETGVCEICSKEEIKFKCEGVYLCSKPCFISQVTRSIVKICNYCGDETEVINSKRIEHNDNFYCDSNCYKSHRSKLRVEYECDWCGEVSTKKKSEMLEHNFCDISCRNEWQKTEEFHTYKHGQSDSITYGSGWSSIKRDVLERDDYKCIVCNIGLKDMGRNPDVHHLTSVQWFKDTPSFEKEDAHYMANLVCLCKRHHTLYEDKKDKLKEEIKSENSELIDKLEFEDPEPLE